MPEICGNVDHGVPFFVFRLRPSTELDPVRVDLLRKPMTFSVEATPAMPNVLTSSARDSGYSSRQTSGGSVDKSKATAWKKQTKTTGAHSNAC